MPHHEKESSMDYPFHERFLSKPLNNKFRWHCEPRQWLIDEQSRCLRIRPEAGTDFWQRTHYGFEADNGHFLYLEARGDFDLVTKVTSRPAHQYDQAGLMVRASPGCWLKTSVEYEPVGANRLGAVVTNAHYSDWSTQPLSKSVETVWFRIEARGSDYTVRSSFDGGHWEQIRLARLHERSDVGSVRCGLYACSPKATGYEAEFEFLHFIPV